MFSNGKDAEVAVGACAAANDWALARLILDAWIADTEARNIAGPPPQLYAKVVAKTRGWLLRWPRGARVGSR